MTTSPEDLKEVLETVGIEPVPETPPATPPEPASPEPPVGGEAPAAAPATPPEPPAEPPVEPLSGLPGEPPAAPAAPPAAPPAAAPDSQAQLIEELRAQIAEMGKRMAAPPPAAPAAPAQPAPAAVPGQVPPVVPAPAASAPLEFFKSEAEVDAALKDAGSFNAFLNKFAEAVEQRMTERIINSAVERTTQIVPEVTAHVANAQVTLLSTVKAWYDENSDLLPFREFCGAVTKELTTAKPNMSLAEALNETEKEVRSRLKLVKPTVTAPATPGGAPPASPGFTPGGRPGGGAQPQVIDKVQKDISDTLGL